MQVSALTAIFKADFGRFRPVPAVFRPISAVSAAGRYDPIWLIRPDFGRISPIRRESKPIRHDSSRIGANRAESARIQEKKKKKKKQNPVPMPSRETIILQFYTLQHDYISTPYRNIPYFLSLFSISNYPKVHLIATN